MKRVYPSGAQKRKSKEEAERCQAEEAQQSKRITAFFKPKEPFSKASTNTDITIIPDSLDPGYVKAGSGEASNIGHLNEVESDHYFEHYEATIVEAAWTSSQDLWWHCHLVSLPTFGQCDNISGWARSRIQRKWSNHWVSTQWQLPRFVRVDFWEWPIFSSSHTDAWK